MHGKLPDVKDLGRYDVEDLAARRGELQQSVPKRIEKSVQLGSDFGHAERPGAEQRLLQATTKHLEDR